VHLWTTRFVRREGRRVETWKDAVLVGVGQAVAVLPGISRSGTTIATGIVAGLERKRAAEFAFLLSIPIILGASAVSLSDALSGTAAFGAAEAAGAVAAFLCAIPSIAVLMKLVSAGRLHRFSYYCWAVGALGVLLTTMH
jgi:undecaprenyl-diphosphatase